MSKSYREALSKVEWIGIPPAAAEVIWSVTTMACRASVGRCWCGVHTSQVEEVLGPRSALDELIEEEVERQRRGE